MVGRPCQGAVGGDAAGVAGVLGPGQCGGQCGGEVAGRAGSGCGAGDEEEFRVGGSGVSNQSSQLGVIEVVGVVGDEQCSRWWCPLAVGEFVDGLGGVVAVWE